MTVSAVLISLVLGTLLAVLLDRKFFGQGVARTLLITPFLIMPVVAGLIWKNQMFSSLYGVVNWVTARLGMDSIEFVSRYPLGSIVVVLVWQWTPFMMLIMLAGLQSQPAEVLEAAKVDGATCVRDVPPADAPPPALVHGARHAARHDLPHPGVRPGGRHDRRRSRIRRTSRTSCTSGRSAAAGSSARRRRTASSS